MKFQRVSVSAFQRLTTRLADAEQTLHAIRNGEVDAVVVAGKQGPQVFTLEGADHAYRMLVESMHEGALTLTADMVVLYANQCFARMVQCPLEQVLGSSFRRFLSAEDWAGLEPLVQRPEKSGSKIQGLLNAGDGTHLPVQISLRPLAPKGLNCPTLGMLVTDLTAARRTEELLRTLTQRVVQVQEAERESVARELHGHITQLLCAVLVRSQALANKLSARDGQARKEAIKLREMLGQAANEVERISRELRPSILDELGLVALMRDVSTEFAEGTGVAVRLTSLQLARRLPSDIELTLYRILQLALKNVAQHAHARQVTVQLTKRGGAMQLTIQDDGVGFDPERQARRKGPGHLGLLSMRERAAYVGGEFKLKSARGAGTEIEVHIPLGNEKPSLNGRARHSVRAAAPLANNGAHGVTRPNTKARPKNIL